MTRRSPHIKPLSTGQTGRDARFSSHAASDAAAPGVRVLITGAGGSAAYNFVDALCQSDRRYECVGTDISPCHLELLPVERRYLNPGVEDENAYIATLNRIVERERIDLVHPQLDAEVALLARHRERLAAPVFLPSGETIQVCQDKAAFHRLMELNGVPAPRSYRVSGRRSLAAAVEDLLCDDDRVLLRAIRGGGPRASLPVTSPVQAEAWVDYWRAVRGLRCDDFIVSELLPGAKLAWQSVWRDGELLTSQARERVSHMFAGRTSGQTSSPSVARTVSRDDVNRIAEAAVRALVPSPHGVFCVDLKEDRVGAPRVTGVNAGRFSTTSNFFAHAGLNMPDLYVRLGVGETLTDLPPRYNPLPDGLYWVRMMDMGFRLVPGAEWSSMAVDPVAYGAGGDRLAA